MATLLHQQPTSTRCDTHSSILNQQQLAFNHRSRPISAWPSSISSGKLLNLNWSSRSKRNNLKTSGFRSWRSIKVSVQPSPEAKVLQASTMQDIYEIVARRLFSAAVTTLPPSKYVVGLAGPPGAGKSTVAKEVCDRINELWRQAKSNTDSETKYVDDVATYLPMDGFHLYRYQLDMMEDPAEAHARRGAPWTFDPEGLIKCLNTLRSQGCVSAPSFDHGVGDPVENDIVVNTSHRVVVVEGNYLLLEDDKWQGLANLFDERWFLDVDIDTTLNRVYNRFLSLGIPPEDAKRRLDYNDRKNAELIFGSKEVADLVIKSVDFEPEQ